MKNAKKGPGRPKGYKMPEGATKPGPKPKASEEVLEVRSVRFSEPEWNELGEIAGPEGRGEFIRNATFKKMQEFKMSRAG